jgi:hypothetical protein
MFGFDALTTGFVVTVNVTLEDPAGTLTDAGTVAADGVSDETFMLAPPAGAAALRLTVPCADVPPITLDGLIVMDDKAITTVLGTTDTRAEALVVA